MRPIGQRWKALTFDVDGALYDQGPGRRAMLCRVLREDRFGFEPEVTAKIAKIDCRIYEVPISYRGRTYAEGKKITWRDGIRGVWCTLRYNLFD
ncbi:MAG: hypothetical protein LAN37_00080 [Acidobacteriia bacterium]|nr:hypothetical protein [Terriglobia bacterium]